MQIPDSIEEVKLWAVIAGALGAALSLNSIQGLTTAQRVMTVISGAAMAGFLSQPIIHWVGFPVGVGFSNAVSFLIGMFGVSVAGSIIKMIHKADLWPLASEILRSWFTRKGG